MNKLKVLDLFSGIGGFSYGLDQLQGFETVAFCEIDKFCQKVLKKHYPNVPIFEDIKKLTCKENEYDVICGGFPCQDISVAGLKKGITNETRSGLWFEYKRIIKEVKPRWVIIENVRNLLNNGFSTVLKGLHEIGYDAEWQIISARSVGAPHLRERIWIVAYPIGNGQRGIQSRGSSRKGRPEEVRIRRVGEEGSDKFTNSESERVQGLWPTRKQKSDTHGQETISLCDSEGEKFSISNSNDFRFWPSFTTEEEKSEWWTKATSSFCDRWKVEPAICRVDNGLPAGLDKDRASRVKALGNSIVPQIVSIIGERILYHEESKK